MSRPAARSVIPTAGRCFNYTLATMMITRGIGSVVVGGMSVTWPQAADEAAIRERSIELLFTKKDCRSFPPLLKYYYYSIT